MKYQVGKIIIDCHRGTIQDQAYPLKVRSKTFQVLLYLLQNRHRAVSKQELLNELWQDVITQEYVIYQSIKEIREIFSLVKPIRTFPRKGYQWIADTREHNEKSTLRPVAMAASVFLAVMFGLALSFNQLSTTLSNKNILVNQLIDSTNGSAEYSASYTNKIFSSLESMPHSTVLINADNPRLEPLQTLSPADNAFLLITNNNYSLHTQLYKQRDELQLHYVLLNADSIDRGVIFDNNLQSAFTQLQERINQQVFADNFVKSQASFSNEALFLGMNAYMAQDYVQAEAFLTAATHSKPEVLPLWRYLSKAQIAQGKFELARQTLLGALSSTELIPTSALELRLLNEIKAIVKPISPRRESSLVSSSQLG